MKNYYLSTLCTVLFLTAFSSKGQEISLKPVSGTYALEHVTVIPKPGSRLEDVTVIVKDGLIMDIGQELTIPPEAIYVKADSMLVYAGFIDGLSHAGIPEPKRDEKRERPKNPSNPTNEEAGITPQADVRDQIDPKDRSIQDYRQLGFTIVHTVPRGQMLPGNGALILLDGDKVDDMVLRDHVTFFSQLDGARGVYPSTVMGVMAKYRELYKNAQLVQTDQGRYNAGVSGMEHPRKDRVLQSFYPVINGSEPVMFKAGSVLDIQRALILKSDLKFNLMLGGVKQAWDVLPQIKEQHIPVFLSLDLPEWKKIKEDTTLTEEKAAEWKRLLERDSLMLQHYYSQPALFAGQAVSYGFSLMDAKPKDVLKVLREMKKRGVTGDQLLAALTVQPAALFGMSAITGTVEKGKIANLVLSDKDLFDEKASIRYVFVDGTLYTYEPESKKNKGTKGEAHPQGKWNFKADTSEGVASGTVTITGEVSAGLSGTLYYEQTADSYPLRHVTLSGQVLSFSVDIVAGGQTINAEVVVTLDNDHFEGSVTVQGSQFSIEGERIPE